MKTWIAALGTFLSGDRWLPWLPVVASLLVYVSVLGSGFLWDDFLHLYDIANSNSPIEVLFAKHEHLLQSFRLSLWLNYSVFGSNPLPLFVLGLLLHLVSVRLLFEITLLLTHKINLAAFGASIWGMSPFIGGTLGWISVHGSIYSTVLVLWVLLDLVRCSECPASLTSNMLFRHVFLLLISATSFGIGWVLAIVFVLFSALWNPVPTERRRLMIAYGSTAILALLIYAVSNSIQGDTTVYFEKYVDGAYSNYMSPVIIFYKMLVIGVAQLILGPAIVGQVSLFEGGDVVGVYGWTGFTTALPMQVSTLTMFILALPLYLLGFLQANKFERRTLLAMMMLPCAVYMAIALARLGFWADLVPAMPRYYYFSTTILTIVFCVLLGIFIDRLPRRFVQLGRPALLIWLVFAIYPYHLGASPVASRETIEMQEQRLAVAMDEIRIAIAKGKDGENVYIRNRPTELAGLAKIPELAALYIIMYPENIVDGKRIYFLEESEEEVKFYQAKQGSRISEILVIDQGR